MSYTLLTHIIAAVLTLTMCTYSWFKPSQSIRSTMRLFTLLAVGSGIFLVADPTVFSRSFCVKIGLYLLFITLTEYHLHKTIDQISPIIV